MTKCRDCIHMDVCELNPFITAFSPDNDAYCGAFKDRAEYPKLVHGYWIRMSNNPLVNKFTCSVCGCVSLRGNYCPVCGAKMDGDGNG